MARLEPVMTTPPPRTSSKSAAGGKKIFGLPRLYVYGGAIAIIAGIAFYLYKEHKASSAATITVPRPGEGGQR